MFLLEGKLVDRALAAKLWMRRVCASSAVHASFTTHEAQFLELLTPCLSDGENFIERWREVRAFVKGVTTLEFSSCEQSVLLIERAIFRIKPRYILEILPYFDDEMRQIILDHWQSLAEHLSRCAEPESAEFLAVCCGYVAYKARILADYLEHRFVECDNLATSRGDSYIIRDDIYYYNFNHLCAEFGLTRAELVERLRLLSHRVFPSSEELELLGGEAAFSVLIEAHLGLDGESTPNALKEFVGFLDGDRQSIVACLSPGDMRSLAVKLISRRLSFELQPTDYLEVFELSAIWAACGQDLKFFLRFMHNLYAFEGDADLELNGPPAAWLRDWASLVKSYGLRTSECLELLLPVYGHFSKVMGGVSFYRLSAGWQACCLDSDMAMDWLVAATTADGSSSPIKALSLLHMAMSRELLARLAKRWSACVERVPLHPSWDKHSSNLVLRYVIQRQRSWLTERLSDLYLRGGGYESGQTREWVFAVLSQILDGLRLSDADQSRLNGLELDFSRLPSEHNVFTGEAVDASRWASPTSAHKYVRSLLRLEGRGFEGLTSLVRERRLLALEKTLRRLDFHTSVQQVVFCVQAFGEDVESALQLLLLLRASSGERPSVEWLSEASLLLGKLDSGSVNQLLWQCYDYDGGEEPYTLNPGLFWAMRLNPSRQSVSQIARATTEMVRRRPSFAIAALDSLDAISTRSSLSAILQMRRRIRNRRVLKLINRCIDRIAKEEGLDRNVFLDYAVDTGDLDSDSSRQFDFGSHVVSLVIESGAEVATHVLDAKGRRLRSFPKNAKDADPELYKEFQFTKKLIVESLSYQSQRLEQAMVGGRCWLGHHFNEIFLSHPLMRQLGFGLIWGRHQEGDSAGFLESFTSAPEGLIDVDGVTYEIDLQAQYRILHPYVMSEMLLCAWEKRLKLIGLGQVFEQLSRQTYSPSLDELGKSKLERFKGLEVDANGIYRLIKEQAWVTDGGGPWEVGVATHSTRRFAFAKVSAHLSTDILNYERHFQLLDVYFEDDEGQVMGVKDVPEVVFSETLRDIYLCLE